MSILTCLFLLIFSITLKPPITVPADASIGSAGFTIQLGSNWAQTKTKDSASSMIGPFPLFVRQNPKTHKQDAVLKIMAIPNPPASMISGNRALLARKKNGQAYWTPVHFGQFTGGFHVARPPKPPDGRSYHGDITAMLIGPSISVNMVADYSERTTTPSDEAEFIAMMKSFRPLATR